MTKKRKKKESWKERRRRAALKYQRALEAERLRRERQSKRSKEWSRSKVLGIGFIVLIGLVAGVYAALQSVQPSNKTGQLPPLYKLTDAEFSEFRGKVIVLDCFATWCEPCKTEIPHLAEINGKYNDRVVVISVGSPSDSDIKLREFKRDYNMDWAVARDTMGVFNKYNVVAVPTIVILDQNGNVYYRNEGVTSASVLSSKIDELLGP